MIAKNLRHVEGDEGIALTDALDGVIVLQNKKGDTLDLTPDEVRDLLQVAEAFNALTPDLGNVIAAPGK